MFWHWMMEYSATHELTSVSTSGHETAARYTSVLQQLLTNSAATCVVCRHVGLTRQVMRMKARQTEGGARSSCHQLADTCSMDRTAKTRHIKQHTARCWVQDQHMMLLCLQKTKLVVRLIQQQRTQLLTEQLSCVSSCQLVSNEKFHLQAQSAQL